MKRDIFVNVVTDSEVQCVDDFSNIERFITIRLIQEDAETIYSLLKSERDPVFSICVIPYYALFVQSCEEYAKTNAFDEVTAKKIKIIRNNIKAYADKFGKTRLGIISVDGKQDSSFRSKLRFDFMRSWNIHYNLGTYWNQDRKIIGNSQMLSDVLAIEDLFAPGIGESQMKLAEQIASYISSIRAGLAENFPAPEVHRKNCTVQIPFYCDFNTNRKNGMIKKEVPKEINLLYLHLLCSLNFVRYILSDMFFPGNTWIFRIQYITTYYAYYVLGKLNNWVSSNHESGIDIFSLDSLLDEGKELFCTKLRNCMMHYDLQGRGVLTIENLNKPLFGLVENCFSGKNFKKYLVQLESYRNKLCEYLEQYFDFSKVEFKDAFVDK